MAALLLFHSKVILVHKRAEGVAVAELKVWQVPKTKHFPEGIKYSLFLVNKESGVVLIGHDNHKPKGTSRACWRNGTRLFVSGRRHAD